MLIWFTLGLEIVQLALTLEEEFNIRLSDDEVAEAETVGMMYILVCDKLGLDPTVVESAPTPKGWTQSKVWDTLCAVIHQQLELPKSEITFDARFVDDLGMD